MKQVEYIIDCLERTPIILNNLLSQIPQNRLKEKRVEDKWSIHEQVCHLVEAQDILIDRFRQFANEENPVIKVYNPPSDRKACHYLDSNMELELNKFPHKRREMVSMLKGFETGYWELTGSHDMFSPYNTQILLTHALNVDYAHLFSIEQLGLTKPEFSNNILTIP